MNIFSRPSLDKTFQRSDWGVRPLSPAELEYAALDPEWCFKVHEKLRKIPLPPPLSRDDPAEISARYVELLEPLRNARTSRGRIRDAVKEFMLKETIRRLSRFELSTRATHSVDLAALVEFAGSVDPAGFYDLQVALPERLLSLLPPGSRAKVRGVAEIGVSQAFRGPSAPRTREPPAPPYRFNPRNDKKLTSDYEAAEHEYFVLESERDELRQRMKLWMQAQDRQTWGKFSFSVPSERWKVRPTRVGGHSRSWRCPDQVSAATETGLPRRRPGEPGRNWQIKRDQRPSLASEGSLVRA